jgi:hypothetical protein
VDYANAAELNTWILLYVNVKIANFPNKECFFTDAFEVITSSALWIDNMQFQRFLSLILCGEVVFFHAIDSNQVRCFDF